MAITSADPTIHRQVVAAAGTLLGTEPAASMGRVADEAGVSRATLYRHFASRQALLDAAAVAAAVLTFERFSALDPPPGADASRVRDGLARAR